MRKPVGSALRFEIFKRDGFRCAYCGKNSNETTLHCDHVKPVSKGGGNEPENLITSCADCNLGKSDRDIDDTSKIEKMSQNKKIRDGVTAKLSKKAAKQKSKIIKDQASQKFYEDYFSDLTSAIDERRFDISATEKRKIVRAANKYGEDEIIECMSLSVNQYYERFGPDKALNMIIPIAQNRKNMETVPFYKEYCEARMDAKTRWGYVGWDLKDMFMEVAHATSGNNAINAVRISKNWTQFQDNYGEIMNV